MFSLFFFYDLARLVFLFLSYRRGLATSVLRRPGARVPARAAAPRCVSSGGTMRLALRRESGAGGPRVLLSSAERPAGARAAIERRSEPTFPPH